MHDDAKRAHKALYARNASDSEPTNAATQKPYNAARYQTRKIYTTQ